MTADRFHYRTCIVRAWREEVDATDSSWRLTLEVPSLGVRHGFSNFQELVDTLHRHLVAADDESAASEQGGAGNGAPH